MIAVAFFRSISFYGKGKESGKFPATQQSEPKSSGGRHPRVTYQWATRVSMPKVPMPLALTRIPVSLLSGLSVEPVPPSKLSLKCQSSFIARSSPCQSSQVTLSSP